ncbi:MAG: hypothetical protein ACLP59_26455 [Bryobacteraceae bacterium]
MRYTGPAGDSGTRSPGAGSLRYPENEGCTMTVMLDLPPEKEAKLIAVAQAKGLSTDALVLEALDKALSEAFGPADRQWSLQDELTPEEWVRQFDAWVEGHNRTTPLLSDEDVSRESIYPDRI